MLESARVQACPGRSIDGIRTLWLELMTDIASFRSLLPLLIPLAGAWVAWILPPGSFFARVRRWFHIVILLGTCAFLVILGTRGADAIRLPFWGQLFEYGDGLEFSVDVLTISFALLLTAVLAVISVSLATRPMDRFDAVTSLVMVGSGIGTCMATNLLTLCLMWAMTDLALLGIDLIRVPEESIPHAIRSVLNNLLSTLALITAAVLLLVERKTTSFSGLLLSGMPLELMMAAALLRLSIYPLPGSLKRRWEAHLASLITGSYLWLRIVGLAAGKLPGVAWLMPFCGGTLLITGLLISLSPDLATSLPYLLLNGIIVIVCAPLVEAKAGLWVALVTALNLSLCLALVRADVQVWPMRPLGRWVRIPLIIAFGSLIGWPLTLGFVAHWSFLKLCWTTGWRGLVLLGAVSYLFASVPVWNRLRQMRHEVRERGGTPRMGVWIALGCVCLVAVTLVALGIDASLLQRPWLRLSGALRLPTLPALLGGDIRQIGILLLTVVIVPILGGYAFQRLWANAPRWLIRGTDAVSALLELDWLYLGLEGVLVRVRFLLNQAAISIEQALCLSWVLLWSLVIALFLLGG